jgi:hypothetical protein
MRLRYEMLTSAPNKLTLKETKGIGGAGGAVSGARDLSGRLSRQILLATCSLDLPDSALAR